MAEQQKYRFDTLALHAGQAPDPTTGARAVPLYQTTSYVFKSAEHAANLFALKEFGNIYTRLMNPTTDVFEKRIAAIEGGTGALGVASGQAAITYALLAITRLGDEIVAANNLYGGTYQLLHYTFPKLGRTVKFVDARNPDAFKKAITPKTRAIYAETIGNPKLNVRTSRRSRRLRTRTGSRWSWTIRSASGWSGPSTTARTSWPTRPRSILAAMARRSAA